MSEGLEDLSPCPSPNQNLMQHSMSLGAQGKRSWHEEPALVCFSGDDHILDYLAPEHLAATLHAAVLISWQLAVLPKQTTVPEVIHQSRPCVVADRSSKMHLHIDNVKPGTL